MQTALILLAALAFGASLYNGHVYDDYAIFSDSTLFAPSGWWEVWLTHTRPLTYFTFWLELQLTESTRLGHAINLALHLVAVWLAFQALNRLLPAGAATVATLLFAIHPLQGETVNYIWARSTLLMAVFCLLSLRDWLGDRRWLAVVWFALAVLAKEECLAFPIFLILLELWRKKSLYGETNPILAMLLVAGLGGARVLWVASTTPGSQAGAQAPYTAMEYLGTQGLVILRYLGLLLVPVGLTPDPPITAGVYWWAWLVIAAGLLVGGKYFAIAGMWFVGGVLLLLPSSSVFPASELSADRRMYLPMLAFSALVGLMVQRWWKAVVAGLALVLIPVSIARTRVWSSDQTLWMDALEKNPRSVRARLLLARKSNNAIPLLEEAKTIDPENPQVATELGRAYLQTRGAERALPEFGRALALEPNSPEAFSNRGVALLLLKQTDAAKQDFERALKIEPCFWDARYNLKRMGVDSPSPPGCRYTPWLQRMLDEIH